MIFINDPLPAHVHCFGDGEAKVDLVGADGAPALVWADAMSPDEVRRAMSIAAGQQAFLLERWKDIHGRSE